MSGIKMKFATFMVLNIYCQAQGTFLQPIKTVDTLDINKYLGRWYEVSEFLKFLLNLSKVSH